MISKKVCLQISCWGGFDQKTLENCFIITFQEDCHIYLFKHPLSDIASQKKMYSATVVTQPELIIFKS